MGNTVSQWFTLWPHSNKAVGSIPSRGSFCVEFAQADLHEPELRNKWVQK